MKEPKYVARPMNQISDFHSQVDIIIPYHGQYEKVMTLLESIFRLTRSNFYKVIVVDDCSPNESYIKAIRDNSVKNAVRNQQPEFLTAIRTEEQKGFGGACEAGYLAGESPYVCFLNSDCIVEDSNWLRAMGESLLKLKEKGVRMVSATTNNPVGGHDAQLGEKFQRSLDDVVLADGEHLTMYCFMCHRELFKRVGGFIKPYPYGYFEDIEFARRMNKHGFKQAVCKNSWVHHEGASTFRTLLRNHPNLENVVFEENKKRCIDDVGGVSNTKATA